ncbi:armadillo-type protein [Mycena rebaudengoi]|nr:armadillo-type protein [Mycena rebaudengoi]
MDSVRSFPIFVLHSLTPAMLSGRRPPDRLLEPLDGLGTDAKAKIKQDALMTLGSASQKAGAFASQVVAAIAAVELPLGQWGELIEMLLGFVNTQANVNLRIATLQTIGFICESIKPEILTLRSNEILTAVIHGARKEEPSPKVQLAAIHALFNSLEFVRDNFEREGERNYIMQVVCEATQNASVNVQVGAFECLVRIMGMYYDKMGFYMEQALFGLTVVGMKHTDERVALQAVEFWSTVCEEEVDLAIEAQEAQEYGEAPESESKCFAKIALPEIIPVLLLLLTKQEEDADDEWNVSMAAGTCLVLLAGAVQDAVVPAVIPLIEVHIKATDWHQREAAVITFGSILEGPDPIVLTPLVAQALPLLIDMMTDVNAHVKDTTAWMLGRICDLLIQTIKPDVHLHPLVSALVGGLGDNPRITVEAKGSIIAPPARMRGQDALVTEKMAMRDVDEGANGSRDPISWRTASHKPCPSYNGFRMSTSRPRREECCVHEVGGDRVFLLERLLARSAREVDLLDCEPFGGRQRLGDVHQPAGTNKIINNALRRELRETKCTPPTFLILLDSGFRSSSFATYLSFLHNLHLPLVDPRLFVPSTPPSTTSRGRGHSHHALLPVATTFAFSVLAASCSSPIVAPGARSSHGVTSPAPAPPYAWSCLSTPLAAAAGDSCTEAEDDFLPACAGTGHAHKGLNWR